MLISHTDAPARMTIYVPNFEMNFFRISLLLKKRHFLLCDLHFHKSYNVYGVCGYVHFHHLAVWARYRVSVSSAIRNAKATYNCKCMPSAEDTPVTPALATTFAGKCSVTDFNVFIEKYVFILECVYCTTVNYPHQHFSNNIGPVRYFFPYAHII